MELHMTSISSLDSTTMLPPPPPQGGGKIKAAMQAAAQTLGLSDDDLKTQLQSGKSLADVAQTQCVSTDDLESAMTSAIGSSSSTSASSSTSSTSTLVANLVNRKGGGHGGHHHHHAPAATDPTSSTDSTDPTVQNNLQTLATALGTDPSDLMSQLQSGDFSNIMKNAAAQFTQGGAAGQSSDLTGGLQVDTYAF
jgi:hypothetical protein